MCVQFWIFSARVINETTQKARFEYSITNCPFLVYSLIQFDRCCTRGFRGRGDAAPAPLPFGRVGGPDRAASDTFFSAMWPVIHVAEKKYWLAKKKPANLNPDGPKLCW